MRCEIASASCCEWVTEDEGYADLALQCDQLALHLFAQLGIERTQRLVEQQQARLVDQPARQRHTLFLATRQLVRELACLVLQVHEVERLAQPCRDLVPVPAGHLQREGDVLRHRHVRKKRVALEDGMHRSLLGRDAGQWLAVEQQFTAIRFVETGDHAQDGRLAAA